MRYLLFLLLLASSPTIAKEVAFTFDDAPFGSTNELIEKLKILNLPPTIIFANPCKGKDVASTRLILEKYRTNGHWLANHTCTHPKLDDVGYEIFSADAEKADGLLTDLFSQQKFFRFPTLNEGTDLKTRDQMRAWLKEKNYRNGMVSADNEDQFFSAQVKLARELGKKINYTKVKGLFIKHMISSLECDDELAVQTLGRSPKHVMLLHEREMTVRFLGDLVVELRKRGWRIIDPLTAYEDQMYFENPKNTFAGYGIISQLAYEKTGKKTVCYDFKALKKELNQVLGITN